MERAHPHGTGSEGQRFERRVEPFRKLHRGPLVEGDDADCPGVRAAVHEPRDPRHERCGLAAPRGRDYQHGTGRRRGGRTLIRCEPCEALGDGCVRPAGFADRGSTTLVHPAILAGAAYRVLVGHARADRPFTVAFDNLAVARHNLEIRNAGGTVCPRGTSWST